MRGKAGRIARSSSQCRPLANTNETHLITDRHSGTPDPRYIGLRSALAMNPHFCDEVYAYDRVSVILAYI